MAYSFFLSLFPSIIFLFTLLPYVPVSNLDTLIQGAIRDVMPINAHAFLFEAVENLTEIPRGGLLSLGFLLALIFASNGLLTMITGFEKSHEVSFKDRHFIKKRGLAIALTIFVGLAVLVTGTLIAAGNTLLALLFETNQLSWGITIIKWGAILFLFYSVISVIYRFGPPLKRKFGLVSPGTTLATIFCIATSVIFSYVIDNFGTQSKVYGSLGALMVMMVYLQLNSSILLVGFELNASIAVNRDLRRRQETTD